MQRSANLSGMKLAALVMAVLVAAALGLAGCSSNSSTAGSSSSSSEAKAAEGIGTHHAVIEVEGYAPVTVELDGDAAPTSVQNFMDLAQDGYYDGKTFYRIVDDFCLQGALRGIAPQATTLTSLPSRVNSPPTGWTTLWRMHSTGAWWPWRARPTLIRPPAPSSSPWVMQPRWAQAWMGSTLLSAP